MGFPGTTLDKIEIDAQTFASWEVDYLKYDGCNSNPVQQMLGKMVMSLVLFCLTVTPRFTQRRIDT